MNKPLYPEIEAPDGTCVPLIEGGPWWIVKGRCGWYRVDEIGQTCSCAQWKYRTARALTPCRHLRALADYQAMAGLIRNRLLMEEDERLEADVQACIEDGDPGPLPSDAELRKLFQ